MTCKMSSVSITRLSAIRGYTTLPMLSNVVLQVDVSGPMALVMAPKDESEIITVKKSCQATMDLFKKFLQEQIMDLIDSEKVGK